MFFGFFCSDHPLRDLEEIYNNIVAWVEQLCLHHRNIVLQSHDDNQLLQEYVRQRVQYLLLIIIFDFMCLFLSDSTYD